VKTAVRFSLERIAALDRAVRAGEFPNAGTLADRLEVGRRTVQRDIEFLRDRLGMPLEYDPARHGYYYTDPTYPLPLLALTEGELVALFLAERVLAQYRGTPYAPDLARAFHKITAGLTDRVTIDLGHLDRLHSFRTTAAPELDPELFRRLDAAIRRRDRLRLRYYSASRDEETAREVDPYHLASVDGQWYLVGYCHLRGAVRMFAPGRIRSLEEAGATFEPPADFRIDDYLARSFSVLRGEEGEVNRVSLRFSGEAVRYVRERTWHPSQTMEATPEGDLIVGLAVSHLREVARWVLSWGADCEVLEPPVLRDGVAAESARVVASYTRRPAEGEHDAEGEGRDRRTRMPPEGGGRTRRRPT
jgi:predicted DNA-binding transcriptional regulator YafY